MGAVDCQVLSRSKRWKDIEARTIALFTPPNGPLSKLGQPASISVPLILHYDTSQHVLVFEDLGPLVTLDNYLTAYPCGEPATGSKRREACHRLGSRIGEFFAML